MDFPLKFKFDNENAFCISLENSPRWDRMLKRFKYFDLEVSKWKASTPHTLTDKFINGMGGGGLGCAQSHINIWRHIISNELPYALILEDDTKFDKKWLEKLEQFDVGCDWDAVFLNASEKSSPINKWVTANEQYLTGGYIISLQGAKYIMDLFKNEFHASDWMTSRLQLRNKSYTYFPWLIIQEGLDSSISSKYIIDHNKVKRLLNSIKYDLDNYV